jgi:uncharacterized delta-60 repeat protein
MGTLAQPGQPDPGFGSGLNVITTFGGNNNEQGWAMAIQSDGKIVVAGFTGNGGYLDPGNNFDFAVVRYNTDGTLDNTFGTGGQFTWSSGVNSINDQAHGIAIQSDGKMILVGRAGTTLAILRLNANGTLDNTFNGTGFRTMTAHPGINQANAVLVQPDGKYLIAGSSEGGPNNSDFLTIRLNTDGSSDLTFDGDGIALTNIDGNSDDYPLGMVLQNDGKIVLSGTSLLNDGTTDVSLARLNTDGTIDNTFSGDGVLTTHINTTDVVYNAVIDNMGRIIVAGHTALNEFQDDDITRDFLVIRYNSDGTLDNTFGGTGIVVNDLGGANDDKGNDIALQSNGRIVVGGYSDRTTNHDYTVARYNTNGTLDATFDGDGIASFPPIPGELTVGIAMKLVNNRIYLAGTTYSGGQSDFSIIAFQNDNTPLPLNLLSFNAVKQTNNVLLQWQTEKEKDILGFDIQRSSDGKTYKNIGYSNPISANGGSIKKNYSYTDNQPLSAVNYYRLAIKDLDGKIVYSKILAIKNNGSGNQQLEVFPNPVSAGGVLQLQLPSGLTGRTNVQISDVTGRVMKTLQFDLKGHALATAVDVSTLTKGVYIVNVKSTGKTNLTTRFVKN